MNVRALEQALADIVRHLRREAEAGDAALERRLVAIETRMMGGDTVAAKVLRGEPVGDVAWLRFCERLRQPMRLGQWAPNHASWRGGGHAGDRRP